MAEYLTALLPGTGGVIKRHPDDFCVEEIPLYPPCGCGEHLYVTVEKTGLTTHDLVHRVGRALNVAPREIGYAGLKDARARTRQTLSLSGVKAEQALGLDLPGVRVLAAAPHRNKLRLGHLAGNRFTIRVREVVPDALERALDILHVLSDLGVPNRFGDQRYGSLGNSHLIGRAIVRGDFDAASRLIVGDPATIRDGAWRAAAQAYIDGAPAAALEKLPQRFRNERNLLRALAQGESARQAVLALPRPLLRLYLSAYQSSLFDRIVDMRLGSLARLWPGDLACKHVNGATFAVEDAAAEQPRADAFEISPTAPLYGCKVTLAKGQAGLLEEALLEKEGLTPESFRLGGGLDMDGERRPLRVPLADAEARLEGGDLLLAFRLPKGSYATSVLREVLKTDCDTLAGDENE